MASIVAVINRMPTEDSFLKKSEMNLVMSFYHFKNDKLLLTSRMRENRWI